VDETIHVRGIVRRERYAPGSKSEHLAAVLHADDGATYLLRRPGANPYDDPELTELVGAMIEATGRRHRDVLLLERWSLVTGSPLRHRDAPAERPPSARRRSPRRPRSGS
jgi:hypothetical protein